MMLGGVLQERPGSRTERGNWLSWPPVSPMIPTHHPGWPEGRGGGVTEPGARLLLHKLEQFGTLSAEELGLLRTLSPRVVTVGHDQDVLQVGDRATHCSLLLEGFLCRYRMLEDGRRQITSFHVPGDIPDLTVLLDEQVDYALSTLTPVKIAVLPRTTLLSWIERSPRLGFLFWKATLLDAAIQREWAVNLGRRTAYESVAHLLCELVARLDAGGLVRKRTCDLPITQTELADATGLSTVHVNRTLQQLRGERLLEWRGGTLAVSDWQGLSDAAGFDPAYLQLSAGADQRMR